MMLRELGGVVGPQFEGLGVTVQGLSTPRTHLDATVYAVAEEESYIYNDNGEEADAEIV
jgi:hypothetical protein